MKSYQVDKYVTKKNGEVEIQDLGHLPEEDVKRLLKGYKFDKDMGLWFSHKCSMAYDVQEV